MRQKAIYQTPHDFWKNSKSHNVRQTGSLRLTGYIFICYFKDSINYLEMPKE